MNADAELRHGIVRMLADMLDAVQSGRVRRWQLLTIAPSLRMLHHILTTAPGTPVSIETGRSEP